MLQEGEGGRDLRAETRVVAMLPPEAQGPRPPHPDARHGHLGAHVLRVHEHQEREDLLRQQEEDAAPRAPGRPPGLLQRHLWEAAQRPPGQRGPGQRQQQGDVRATKAALQHPILSSNLVTYPMI